MTLADTALTCLADYRDEMLHDQSPAETRRMQRLGRCLRGRLNAGGITRRQFAERTGETAQQVLRLARAEPGNP